MNSDYIEPLLSCIQHEELGCKIVEGIMDVLPLYVGFLLSAHLDSFGFKRWIDERSSVGDLQGVTSQLPMKCKEEHWLGEIGSLQWEDTKGKNE